MQLTYRDREGRTHTVTDVSGLLVRDDTAVPVLAAGDVADGLWVSDARDAGFNDSIAHLRLGDARRTQTTPKD